MIAATAPPFIGHESASFAAKMQPTKGATLEAVWETKEGLPFHIIQIPDPENERNIVEFLTIPKLGSYFYTHSFDGKVVRFDQIPKDERLRWIYGMLFPFLAKNRQERNQLQEAVGPFWGGNEVWLITAGGATFAAFPAVYADLFSFLYTPMMLILFALFFRAAGLEFMHKDDAPLWQKSWKWAFTISSFALALLFGVAFANLFYGLKIGPSGYEGTFLGLLHPYGLLGGLLFTSLFIVSGALWIMIKTVGDVAQRAYQIARPASVVAAVVLSLFFVATSNRTTLFDNFTKAPILWIVPALTFVCALLMLLFVWQKRIGLAFANICLTIFTLMATGFIGMFPNMLPSRINDEYSTTLFEAAGSELNLKIMLGVAIVMVPIVIGYQLWSYKLFKEKITKETAKGYQ